LQLDTADNPTQNKQIINQAIVKAIIKKHNATTAQKKFNAIFATASINHAIEHYQCLLFAYFEWGCLLCLVENNQYENAKHYCLLWRW
jgi:hypothetical protein